MKIGIRPSILTLFVTILLAIGCIILSVNYFVSHKILLEFAENLLEASSKNIEIQTKDFLADVHFTISYNVKLIDKGLIDPSPTPKFAQFLMSVLDAAPSFSGIHWSTAQGDVNFLEKYPNGTFLHYMVFNSATPPYEIRELLDSQGKVLEEPIREPSRMTPLNRPWFIKATTEKRYVISDVFTYILRPMLFFDAVQPLYTKNGDLRGTLALGISLDRFSAFVTKLKITKNSNAFIFDQKGNLIAASALLNYNSANLLKISDLKIPWVDESFKLYQKEPKELFFYSFQDKTYIAYYKNLASIIDNPWTIGIVLPITDIIGKLIVTFIITAAIIAIILGVGVLLTWILATAISKPIIKLTQESMAIKAMDFSRVTSVKSHIKEVARMQESFSAMIQNLKSFVRYIPFTLVKKLMATGEIATVGGEYKQITLMFIDIYGFTSLSEDMTPQELTTYLSEYFEAVTKIILAYKGTVDKYIGDGVMAFWGAPLDDENHALHACESALAILDALARLNQHWQSANKPTITIRIGINTGNVIVGNVGSEEKLGYTAIGDNVNLSNRLQDINKIYGTTIIISKSTYELVRANLELALRFLDSIAVRGKHHDIQVYELLTTNHPLKQSLDNYNNYFRTAFNAYQKGEWDLAKKLFTELKQQFPQDQIATIFLERCINLQQNPPKNWDGIWHF